jgi:hypothetical protein
MANKAAQGLSPFLCLQLFMDFAGLFISMAESGGFELRHGPMPSYINHIIYKRQ